MHCPFTTRLGVLLICVSVSSGVMVGDSPPKRGQTEIVRFPELGGVKVAAAVRVHELPQVTFSDGAGKVLLQFSLGDRADSMEAGDPYPIVRLKLLQVSGLQTPIVFAGVMYAGGSDCSYWGRLAGYTNGKLQALSPSLPMVNTEGGYSVGQPETGGLVELAAWNMIWSEGEAHPDAHAHWVQVYKFNATTGVFESPREYVVPKPKEVGFSNVLLTIPNFAC